MHDHAGMRVRDGSRRLQCEGHARGNVSMPLGAIGIDWFSIDELERQVGASVNVHAGIVEPRDVRVFERSQDVALARHAFGEVGQRPANVR